MSHGTHKNLQLQDRVVSSSSSANQPEKQLEENLEVFQAQLDKWCSTHQLAASMSTFMVFVCVYDKTYIVKENNCKILELKRAHE